jgi:hypothetical protein
MKINILITRLTITAVFLSVVMTCSPKINTTIYKTYSPSVEAEKVIVYLIDEAEPRAEIIGSLNIGGGDFDFDFPHLLERAKVEAAKIGGNAIKIVKHNLPKPYDICHRVLVKVYRLEAHQFPNGMIRDSLSVQNNYALLHFYRYTTFGVAARSYVYLGDSLAWKGKNYEWESFKVKEEGRVLIRAGLDGKTLVPIRVRFGNEYFVRCNLSVQAAMSGEFAELVDTQTGREELAALKLRSRSK